MFHSAVGHRRRTTSDVALASSRFAKRPQLPESAASASSALVQVPSSLSISQSVGPSESELHASSASEQEEERGLEQEPEPEQERDREPSPSPDADSAGTEGEIDVDEDVNVKRVVLRKHRSDEVHGTRSLARCLAASEVDAMNGFWSRRLSTSKNKKLAAKQAEEKEKLQQQQLLSSTPPEKTEKVSLPFEPAAEKEKGDIRVESRDGSRGRDERTPIMFGKERQREKESFPPSAFAPPPSAARPARPSSHSRSTSSSPLGPRARPLPTPPSLSSSQTSSLWSASTRSSPATPSSRSPTLIPLPPITPSEPLFIDTLFTSIADIKAEEDGQGLRLALSPLYLKSDDNGGRRDVPASATAPPPSLPPVHTTTRSSMTFGPLPALFSTSISPSQSRSPSLSPSPAPSPLFPLTPPTSKSLAPTISVVTHSHLLPQNTVSPSTIISAPSPTYPSSGTMPQFAPTPPLKLFPRGYTGPGARPMPSHSASPTTNTNSKPTDFVFATSPLEDAKRRMGLGSTPGTIKDAISSLSPTSGHPGRVPLAIPHPPSHPDLHTRVRSHTLSSASASPSSPLNLSFSMSSSATQGQPQSRLYTPATSAFSNMFSGFGTGLVADAVVAPGRNESADGRGGIGGRADADMRGHGVKSQTEVSATSWASWGDDAPHQRRRSIAHQTSLPIIPSPRLGLDTSGLEFEGAKFDMDLDLRLDADLFLKADFDECETKAPERRLPWIVMPSSPSSSTESSTVEAEPEFDPERLPGGSRWKGKEKEVYPSSLVSVEVEGDGEGSSSDHHPTPWIPESNAAKEFGMGWPFAPSAVDNTSITVTKTIEIESEPTMDALSTHVARPVVRHTPTSSPATPINAFFSNRSCQPEDSPVKKIRPRPPPLKSALKVTNYAVTPTNSSPSSTFSARSELFDKARPSPTSPARPSPVLLMPNRRPQTIVELDKVVEEKPVEKEREKEKRRLPLPPTLTRSANTRNGFSRLVPHLPHALPLARGNVSSKRSEHHRMPTNTIVTVYSERASNVPFLNIPPPPLAHLAMPSAINGKNVKGKKGLVTTATGKSVVGITHSHSRAAHSLAPPHPAAASTNTHADAYGSTEKPPLPPIPPSAALPIYRKHARRRTSVISTATTKSSKSTRSVRSSRSSSSRSKRSSRSSGRTGSGRRVQRRSTTVSGGRGKKVGRRRTGLARIVVEVKKGGRIAAKVEAGEGTGSANFDAEEVREILERLRNL